MKVLVLLEQYVPGYKAGGPIRTIQNLVEHLHQAVDFSIVTRDRDLGENTTYSGVTVNTWTWVNHARVFYGSSRVFSLVSIRHLVRETRPDIVYLNSFFSQSTIRFLLLRRLGLLPSVAVLLAPRGELGRGALQLKAIKKKLYLALASITRLCSGVRWQATSEDEKAAIQRFAPDASVFVAPNLPARVDKDTFRSARPAKAPGYARFVFLSRISPKKNLLFALELLRELQGKVELDVVGPLEGTYWQQCRQLISTMPPNVTVNYRGSVPYEKVPEMLATAHCFLLPTLNENFGHAIFEALAVGLPVIISDQTPWRALQEKGIGWDIPLDRRKEWQNVLQQCVEMSAEEYCRLSAAASHFAQAWPEASAAVARTQALFQFALDHFS